MEFSRQEYWSRLPFPPPGDLPDPGIEPVSIMAPALAGELFTPVPPGKPLFYIVFIKVRKGDCYPLFCIKRYELQKAS